MPSSTCVIRYKHAHQCSNCLTSLPILKNKSERQLAVMMRRYISSNRSIRKLEELGVPYKTIKGRVLWMQLSGFIGTTDHNILRFTRNGLSMIKRYEQMLNEEVKEASHKMKHFTALLKTAEVEYYCIGIA